MKSGTRIALLIAVALLSLCPKAAFGCVCMGSFERRGCASLAKQHDGVFVGRAMSSTRIFVAATEGRPDGWLLKTSFHVTENFGKPLPSEVDIYVPTGPPPRVENGHVIQVASSCDLSFEIGKDYLVFGDTNDGLLHTNKCAGNRLVQKGDWALESMRHMPPPGTSYVEGVVNGEDRTPEGDTEFRPLAGVTIEVEGNAMLQAHSDEAGRFRFELPPGKYVVKVPLGSLYAPGPMFDFQLIDQDCVLLDAPARLRTAESK